MTAATVAEIAEDAAAALARQVKILKDFLADHPEVAASLGVAVPAGPPVPLTFYHVAHSLIDGLTGIDQERREQMHAAVDDHQTEHEQLLATAAAPAPVTAAAGPATEPAKQLTAVDAGELAKFRAWEAAQAAPAQTAPEA